MDNQYLKINVQSALMEALAAMAVALPEDGVDYLGRYLLRYVERKSLKVKEEEEFEEITKRAKEAKAAEDIKAVVILEKASKEQAKAHKLDSFVTDLDSMVLSKQDLFDKCTNFVSEYLDIPASYIAIKKGQGESENLYYISSNSSQCAIMTGKKLPKPVDEGDESAPHQGFSFEAFKIPPAPEDENNNDDDNEENIPKKVPVAVPLVIENVMRDKRCKFFGIPKLGAFVAVPLFLDSIDHDAGCQSASGDLHRGPFSMNKVNTGYLFCADTIGKYRQFSEVEVNIIKRIGDKMISILENLEVKQFEKQILFLEKHKSYAKPIGALTIKIKSAEDSDAATALDAAGPDASDNLKAVVEAEARAKAYATSIASEPMTDILVAMAQHVLPTPPVVGNLLFVCGALVGIEPDSMKDAAGDVSWTALCEKFFTLFPMMLKKYLPREPSSVYQEATVANLKAFSEQTGIFEPSLLPSYLVALPILQSWCQKALAAREVAIAYAKENDNVQLEKIFS